MTPDEEAEYIRRREAREARRRDLDKAAGRTNAPVRASTKAWRRQQGIKRQFAEGPRPGRRRRKGARLPR